jgi:hypothetical protein
MTTVALQSPSTLAERFWSLAKSRARRVAGDGAPDPVEVVRSVLEILDALETGATGEGLSQATISFLTLLRQEELAGDLSYCSPEQARGEAIDERSLVFSVGVLLFEELTGRHPFGAQPSGRRVARIQRGELGSGVQYFPQLPAALRSMLVKAMGPFPEERYRSLGELRAELERFVRGEEPAKPVPPPVSLRGLPGGAGELMRIAQQLEIGDENAKTTVRKRPAPSPSRRRAMTLAQAGSPVVDDRKTIPFVRPPRSNVVALHPPAADDVRPRVPAWAKRALERLAFVGVGAAVAVAAVAISQRSPSAKAPAPVAAVAAAPAVSGPVVVEPSPTRVAAAGSATASPSLGAARRRRMRSRRRRIR